jgi:unsaturated chondroitin disaccharide hydrolase
MYKQTGRTDPFWQTKATASTNGLKGNETFPDDLEFRVYIAFAPLYAQTKDPAIRDILLKAAESKSKAFNPTVGAFEATWHKSESGNPRANFGVLMDQTMDLELMFWAAKQTGNQTYYNQAVSHAQKIAQHLVRPDGGSYHWGYFDRANGEFISGETAQGYSDTSTWSRGQAWGIYAFTMAYRETGNAQFLATAKKMSDYFIARLPADKIPYWDFNDPRIPNTYRDSSAAALAASGMLELAKLSADPADAKYRVAAVDMLKELASPPTLALGTTSRGILNRATRYVPAPFHHSEASVVWGDYYFLEAINRYQGKWT